MSLVPKRVESWKVEKKKKRLNTSLSRTREERQKKTSESRKSQSTKGALSLSPLFSLSALLFGTGGAAPASFSNRNLALIDAPRSSR